MQITYWEGFSKRKNSTKQPSGAGTTIDVHLKEDTSREHPSFQLSGHNYNMNYVQAFGDYYFVEDIISLSNGISEVVCTMDPMATYKSSIGSTQALIEYTSTSSKITIPDPRNRPTTNVFEEVNTLLDLGNYGFHTTDNFIIGVAGGSLGVTYYMVDPTELKQIFDKIFDTTFWGSVENQFYNFADCLVTCFRVPYTPDGLSGNTSIYIAGQDTGAVGKTFNKYRSIPLTACDLIYPSGSQYSLGQNYLDFEPYTTGTLYLPFVGVVPLDLGICSYNRAMNIGAVIDQYTGDIVYTVSNTSGDYVSTYSGNFAAEVPISSQHANAMGAATGAVSAIGGLAAAGIGAVAGNAAAIAGGLAAAAGSGIGAAASMAVHSQVNGSMSSCLGSQVGLIAKATILTREPAEPTLTVFQASSGMPFFQVDTISLVSGYVKCWNASVNCAATPADKDIINDYLNSGFYYE